MESQGASKPSRLHRQEKDAGKITSIRKMNETVNNIIDNTRELNIQSKEFNETASKPADLDIDAPTLQKLHALLQAHNAEHGSNLEQVKKELAEEFRKQFEGRIKEKIRQEVRESLVAQIKVQIDQQIVQHIPVALKQQLEEVKAQLREVKIALQNSEARTKNGMLNATDLNEPLAVVLTPEAKRSELYPADMCSLLAYKRDVMRALVRDYGLVESDDFEDNFKTFLTYIGVHTDCIPAVHPARVPASPSGLHPG